MANINLQIPDNQVDRVITALCAGLYEPLGAGPPTPAIPVTPTAAIAKQVIMDFVKFKVKEYETNKAIRDIPPVDVSTIVS